MLYAISFPSEYEVVVVYNNMEKPLIEYADFVKREGKWVVYLFSDEKLKKFSSISCVVVVEKARIKPPYRYTCREFVDMVMELNR